MEIAANSIEAELSQMLEVAFGEDERTKEVMSRHNGFNCNRREKLEDIAKDLGVTKEAVRQRSIKGIDRVVEKISELEADQEQLQNTRKALGLIEYVAPCSEEDAQKMIYSMSLTNRQDNDIEALIYLLELLGFKQNIELTKEGEGRFIVKSAQPGMIKDIVKKAREDVTHDGAGDIKTLAKKVQSGHQRTINSIRCVVSVLEAQKDFVWLTEDSYEESGNRCRTGFFLLKDAGRNPVELRLKRIFSVRKECNDKWVHTKIKRSRKAMNRDMKLPVEAVAGVGIAKGICKRAKQPDVLERAMKIDPKKVLSDFEYKIWAYLKENPKSQDSDIMEACMERSQDRFNVRSKLNFSVVIQRVRHGIYAAVTDDYPPLDFVDAVPESTKNTA